MCQQLRNLFQNSRGFMLTEVQYRQLDYSTCRTDSKKGIKLKWE